ncbi:DoxX-like family protein [Halomarina rubra]|uniref:DoxX-like family protein n=1 Tax=Halomarina rubra TaxID=2071873 RepID=A0ABD6AX44_9EURY|nr:DoxX-like family protein [Halomarina rubra]
MTTENDGRLASLKRPLLYLMSLLYIGAGVMHFLRPKVFARIVPPTLPRPLTLVYLSGVAEIVLGVGVLFRRTRRRSAWGLVGLLVAVFPANVYMATSTVPPETVSERTAGVARLALWARLPFQAVLALWAWWYTQDASTDPD